METSGWIIVRSSSATLILQDDSYTGYSIWSYIFGNEDRLAVLYGATAYLAVKTQEEAKVLHVAELCMLRGMR